MNNRKKFFLLIMIIIVVFTILYGWHSYQKGVKNKNNAKQEAILREEKLNNFKNYIFNIKIISFDQFEKNYTIDDMSDEMVLGYLYAAYKNYFINEKKISKDELYNYVNYVFDNNFDIDIKNFGYSDIVGDYCIKYDYEENMYMYNDRCLTEPLVATINKVININEEDNKFYIEAKHYYFYNGSTYNNYQDLLNKDNSIYNYEISKLSEAQNLVSDNFDMYSSDTRKYTFVPNGNEFSFYSYEVVK